MDFGETVGDALRPKKRRGKKKGKPRKAKLQRAKLFGVLKAKKYVTAKKCIITYTWPSYLFVPFLASAEKK